MILLMFAMISILLNLIPCLVSVECLATANHWFPNLVSLMCSEIIVEMWWSLWCMPVDRSWDPVFWL